MNKINILRNGSVTLHIVQLAHAAGECILRHGGYRDVLFPNYFGKDLLSKMKDFSRLQAVTYTGKMIISRKWCQI